MCIHFFFFLCFTLNRVNKTELNVNDVGFLFFFFFSSTHMDEDGGKGGEGTAYPFSAKSKILHKTVFERLSG